MQKPPNEMYGDMEKNVQRSMPNSTVLTQTQTETHVKKHTTPPLILTHTHAHTEKPSLTHTQSLTQSHTLTQTQTHTLTQTQGVRQSSGESSSQSHSQSPRRLPKCGYEVRGYEVSNLNKNNRVSTETQPFVRATRTNNNNINNNSNSINQEDNSENENENDWERKFREVEDNIPDTAKVSRAEVELERERQPKLHVITNTSKNILPASNIVNNYNNGSNGNNNNIDENNNNNNNNNNTNNHNNNNKMHTNGSITVTLGAGVRLSDDELIELLSQPPKNSTALRTKSSYLEFFRGMSSKRMVSLLERGFDKMSGRELEEREREKEKERENEKEREKETQHGGGGGGGESVGESVCVCGGSGSEKAPLTASERALKVKKRMYMLQDVLTE